MPKRNANAGTVTRKGFKINYARAGNHFSACYAKPFFVAGIVGQGSTLAAAIDDLEKRETARQDRARNDDYDRDEAERDAEYWCAVRCTVRARRPISLGGRVLVRALAALGRR